MNKLVLVFLGSLIFILPACKQQHQPPCTEKQNKALVEEVEKNFNNLLNIAAKEDFVNFQNYLDDNVTVMAEGYWVPYDSIPDYVFEIFTNLVHDSVEIKKKAYDVVCCHNTAVYQRVLAFFYPVDTARGCYKDMIIPMSLNITSEKSSTADEDYEAGIETMQIKPVDTSGNNLVLLKPVKRLIPVKTAAISIVWNKENESWKVKHLHLSLGLKRTRIYEMK